MSLLGVLWDDEIDVGQLRDWTTRCECTEGEVVWTAGTRCVYGEGGGLREMNDQARPQHLKAKPVMQQYIPL